MTVSVDEFEMLSLKRLASFLGHLYFFLASEIIAGEAFAVHRLFRTALKHYVSAVDTGTWTDVDYMVGGKHSVFVVFHHDDAVADVAQLL